MKKAVQYIISNTYKPLLKKYLAKERTYSYNGLRLRIHPEVFHPGFFFSTKLLLAQINALALEGKQFLELGAGSGLLAMSAAQKNAVVTATDINPVAVDYLHKNCSANSISLNILLADVFTNVPATTFDIIVINPPYYKKKPASYADYAWYCGENGEYFQKLFGNLNHYIHTQSTVLMVLCDGCDFDMINAMARENNFVMNQVRNKRNLVETNYIYHIKAAL